LLLQEFILLLISVLFSLSGQFFLKLGALKIGKVNFDNFWGHILSIATTLELLIGLFCYGLGAIAYILLITRVKLSIAAPSVALIYIFSVFLGHYAFKETISISQVIGVGLIACGITLIAWQR